MPNIIKCHNYLFFLIKFFILIHHLGYKTYFFYILMLNVEFAPSINIKVFLTPFQNLPLPELFIALFDKPK